MYLYPLYRLETLQRTTQYPPKCKRKVNMILPLQAPCPVKLEHRVSMQARPSPCTTAETGHATEDQPITFHSHKVTPPPHPPNNAQPICSHRTRLYQRLDSYAFLERIFWRGVIRLRVAVARTFSACGTDTRR